MRSLLFFIIFCWSINLWAQSETPQEKKDNDANQVTQEQTVPENTAPEQNTSKETNPFERQHVFTGNGGLIYTVVEGITDPKTGFMLGGKYSFYFSSRVGAFIGLDYMSRNSSEVNWEMNLTSIDIPFGLAFRYRSLFNSLGTTFLGLYYNSLQDGKIEYKGNKNSSWNGISSSKSPLDIEAEDHFGFLLQSETYFEVTESFHLGLFCGIKFGFGDATGKTGGVPSEYENNTFDAMLGLAAKF